MKKYTYNKNMYVLSYLNFTIFLNGLIKKILKFITYVHKFMYLMLSDLYPETSENLCLKHGSFGYLLIFLLILSGTFSIRL